MSLKQLHLSTTVSKDGHFMVLFKALKLKIENIKRDREKFSIHSLHARKILQSKVAWHFPRKNFLKTPCSISAAFSIMFEKDERRKPMDTLKWLRIDVEAEEGYRPPFFAGSMLRGALSSLWESRY
jgi:hypothetical protein